MMDAWTDRLSEYIDGELNATDALALEQHLRECDACRDIVADLRTIAAQAGALQPVAPQRDLWAGIAESIGASAEPAVISLDAHRPRRRASVTFTIPQLAAAAIVLLVAGGTAVMQFTPRSAPAPVAQTAAADGARVTDSATVQAPDTIVPAPIVAPSTQSPVRNVAREKSAVPTLGYDAAIQQLERAAAADSAQLDPATRRVIAESMKTIDRAIADARAALASDPANAYLHRHLDRTMKQKMELLRQAARIQRGGA